MLKVVSDAAGSLKLSYRNLLPYGVCSIMLSVAFCCLLLDSTAAEIACSRTRSIERWASVMGTSSSAHETEAGPSGGTARATHHGAAWTPAT